LNKIARIVLNKKKFDLSIVLVGQARIKELNMEYRKINRPTDVLSFLYRDCYGQARWKMKVNSKGGKLHRPREFSGEIVLCPLIIRQNAKKYKVAFQNELSRILIHGILHLLGFNHERSKERARKMRAKEEYYLSKIYGKR